MKALLAILLAAGALIGAGYLYWSSEPPLRVAAVEVERADVENALTTNGRIEAAGRVDLYAETAGRIVRVQASVGDSIGAGAVVAVVDNQAARAELAQAQARLDAARSELAIGEAGSSEAERLDFQAQIDNARAQRRDLEADLERSRRLIAKEAAPKAEALDLERRMAELEREIGRLERKLAQPVAAEVREQLAARVREAEAAVAQARGRLQSAEIRSPIAGTIYSLHVRTGDFVAPGALAARVAGPEGVQAVLYIDEPELGRLTLGAQATLTADAYPGQSWTCAIDRLPTEVVRLETRRVGEAWCRIEGDPGRLIPNLTVSARIPSASAANAPSLPREAVQREGGETYVWMLDADGRARRVAVETGVQGDARIEIRAGAGVGERVLLPAGTPIEEGRLVEARP